MDLHPKIKEDLLDIIFRASVCLDERDSDELSKLSDRCIHNASIFQDEYSVQIAICLYALSKIIKNQPQLAAEFSPRFIAAYQLIDKNQFFAYKSTVDKIVASIEKIDLNFKQYKMDVLNQAQIKKGSRLYYHGISLGQSAAIMGVSQWELYNYVGKTTIHDDGSSMLDNLDKRLAYTKSIFDERSKNKILVFDAGPIITMAMTNVLSLLPRLKRSFNGDFLIASAVARELIDRPLSTRSHKLEAFQVYPYVSDGTLQIIDTALLHEKTRELAAIANNIYCAHGSPIQIVQEGELESLALLLIIGGQTMVVDEMTMRYLIETPSRLKDRLESRLHTHVSMDKKLLAEFKELTKHVRTIRSIELLSYAFSANLFAVELDAVKDLKSSRQMFYEGLLWSLKYAGCGVSEFEIDDLIKRIPSSG